MSETQAPSQEPAAVLKSGHGLGPANDQALLDGLVERINRTIDERVEERLAEVRCQVQHSQASGDHAQLYLGLSSIGLAIPLTAISGGMAGLPGMAIVWGGIAAVNLAHAVRNWQPPWRP